MFAGLQRLKAVTLAETGARPSAGLSHTRTPAKLAKQTSPVFFCSARLAILAGQYIGIREAPEIVGCRSGGISIYRDKDS
jgi:hypothetical protein